MNIVYLIQCHKNFELIISLIHSLDLKNNDRVIIHVDKKNEELKLELLDFFKKNTNIYIIPDPISVNWSGLSQVIATLKMLNIVKSYKKYNYCCLLSGEDIVLNSHNFKKHLAEKNKSFIDFRDDYEKYKWRINKFNFFRDNKFSQRKSLRLISSLLIRIQKLIPMVRKNINYESIFLGSQWFTLKQEHVDIICKYATSDFINKFKYTSCADEHFFQIIFSKYIPSVEYDRVNLRYIQFENNESSPRYLTKSDMQYLMSINNKEYYIARKTTLDLFNEYNKETKL